VLTPAKERQARRMLAEGATKDEVAGVVGVIGGLLVGGNLTVLGVGAVGAVAAVAGFVLTAIGQVMAHSDRRYTRAKDELSGRLDHQRHRHAQRLRKAFHAVEVSLRIDDDGARPVADDVAAVAQIRGLDHVDVHAASRRWVVLLSVHQRPPASSKRPG